MKKNSMKKGFTLIEMVIAILLVSILAAIAMPTYNTYMMKAHRAEGINTLNSIQLAQEKYRGYNTTYGTLANVWNGVTTTTNGYYNLAITSNTATGFTATATAQGSQANDSQSGTSCSVLTLTVNALTVTQTPSICWTR